MAVKEYIERHAKAMAVVGGVTAASGLTLEGAGLALKSASRVAPQIVTESIPKVVNETSISTLQKFVPSGQGFVQSVLLPATWAIFTGGNSTTNTFAQISLSNALSAGNSTMVPVVTEGLKQVATLGGGVTQTALSPITATLLAQGNSTFISFGSNTALKLTFDGIQYTNGQQQGVFNWVTGKFQTFLVAHIQSVIEHIRLSVVENQSALDAAHKHLIMAHGEITLGAAAAVGGAIAVIISVISLKRNSEEQGDAGFSST